MQELLWKQGAECWASDSSHSSARRVEWSREAWQTAGKDAVCCLALLEMQDLFQQTLPSVEALPWWKSLPVSHRHTRRNVLDWDNALIMCAPVWLEPENRHFLCHDTPAPSTWHGEGSARADLSVLSLGARGGAIAPQPERSSAECGCFEPSQWFTETITSHVGFAFTYPCARADPSEPGCLFLGVPIRASLSVHQCEWRRGTIQVEIQVVLLENSLAVLLEAWL